MIRSVTLNGKSIVRSALYVVNRYNLKYISLVGNHADLKNYLYNLDKKNQTLRLGNAMLDIKKDEYKGFLSKESDSDYSNLIITKKDSATAEIVDATIYHKSENALDIREIIDKKADNTSKIQLDSDFLDLVYDKLYEHTSIPIVKHWMNDIALQLATGGNIIPISVQGEERCCKDFKVYALYFAVNNLIDFISNKLASGEFKITEDKDDIYAKTPSEDITSVGGLDDYLNTFSETLVDKIQKSFRPKFIPGEDKFRQQTLKSFEQTRYYGDIDLYEPQKALVQAAVNNLDKNSTTIIVGETGSGKTSMACNTIVSHARKDNYSTIVMCPGHLVYKWRQEIKKVCGICDIEVITDFQSFLKVKDSILNKKRKRPIWAIVSKDMVKIDYEERPSAIWKRIPKFSDNMQYSFVCPHCYEALKKKKKNQNGVFENILFDETDMHSKDRYNEVCPKCGGKLWAALTRDNSTGWIKLKKSGWYQSDHLNRIRDSLILKGRLKPAERVLLNEINDYLAKDKVVTRAPRRYSIAKYINKYLKHKIDYAVFDELHQLSGESGQGIAFGEIASAAWKTIGLTGTLLNGYAYSLFYILFRCFPETMLKAGYKYDDIDKFAKEYGVYKNITRTKLIDGKQKVMKNQNKLLPGVNSLVFTKFLLENAVFLSLEDISDAMPDYEEIPIPITMDNELKLGYTNLQNSVVDILNSGRVNRGRNNAFSELGRTSLQLLTLLSMYPDQCFDIDPIIDPNTQQVVLAPVSLNRLTIRNKEKKLIELIKEKKALGEKVLVYCHWTNKLQVVERLNGLLKQEDIKSAVLTSNIKSMDREAWIKDKVAEDIDVLICNPLLVETGLDLLDFTSIIFYQLNQNLYTMRQASRRSWRLSQDKNIKVYFLYYKDTLQEQILARMANKLQAAQTLEGKFNEEGLAALANNEDMLMQIASSVVQGIEYTLDIDVFKNTTRHKRTEFSKKAKRRKVNRLTFGDTKVKSDNQNYNMLKAAVF